MMIDFVIKRFFKKIRVFLIIGIILLFIVFPVYLHLCALDELDNISRSLCFKSTDQVDSVATLEHKKKISITTFVVKKHSEVNLFFACIPHIILCVLAPCSRPLFLRC